MKNKIKTAKELNKVLGLTPALPTDDSVSESVMDKKLKKAAGMLTDTEREELSDTAVQVLTALGCEGFESEQEEPEPDEKPKKGKAKKEEPEEESEEEPEPDEKPKKGKENKEESAEDSDDDDEPKKGKKVEMKNDAPAPKAKKEKKEKKAKRSRMAVICDTIKALPKKGMSLDDVAQKANEKYQDECGGEDNYKQSRHTLKVILPVLVEFGIIEVDGDILKPGNN